MRPSQEEEHKLYSEGYTLIAGIDEAGRGPLAGPVVAAAVVFPHELDGQWQRLVRDSKTLSAVQRERALVYIQDFAKSVGVGASTNEEIDTIGIVKATKNAMSRAISSLTYTPQFLLIDALPLPEIGKPFKAIIKGDSTCLSIAAASIVAKVTRDSIMEQADQRYPGYGFARHKGYPTYAHLAKLAELGPCPIHRRSFSPVRKASCGSWVYNYIK
jgi:ribonuclease HII